MPFGTENVTLLPCRGTVEKAPAPVCAAATVGVPFVKVKVIVVGGGGGGGFEEPPQPASATMTRHATTTCNHRVLTEQTSNWALKIVASIESADKYKASRD